MRHVCELASKTWVVKIKVTGRSPIKCRCFFSVSVGFYTKFVRVLWQKDRNTAARKCVVDVS